MSAAGGLDPLELLPPHSCLPLQETGKSSQESLAKGRKGKGWMGLLVKQMLVMVCSSDSKRGTPWRRGQEAPA